MDSWPSTEITQFGDFIVMIIIIITVIKRDYSLHVLSGSMYINYCECNCIRGMLLTVCTEQRLILKYCF